MTNIITLVEDDLTQAWQWVQTEALDIYNGISPLISSALKMFESSVVQQLWSAGAALVQKLLAMWPHGLNLANLETAFLNTLSALGGNLLPAAISLGSSLLQAFLGLLQAKAVG